MIYENEIRLSSEYRKLYKITFRTPENLLKLQTNLDSIELNVISG